MDDHYGRAEGSDFHSGGFLNTKKYFENFSICPSLSCRDVGSQRHDVGSQRHDVGSQRRDVD